MADSTPSDAGSAPPRSSESLRNWLDVIAKLIGAVAIAGVTWVGYNYQSKASLSSVINQREQAESKLRASMLSDLVEPIMGKNGAVSDDKLDLRRQRLLAEMVTLNFHDHFEFKPLLQEVDSRLLGAGDEEGHKKVASDARRVIDRQINMLTSIDGVTRDGAGYPAQATRIDLLADYDHAKSKGLIAPPSKNCAAADEIRLKKPISSKEVASICVPSPDNKVCLLLDLFAPNYADKSITMSTFIYHPDIPKARKTVWQWISRTGDKPASACNPAGESMASLKQKSETLDETHVSIFDFPLTDNSKIMRARDEYRYSVSLYDIDKPDGSIALKVVWFPQGYVTERERPAPTYLK